MFNNLFGGNSNGRCDCTWLILLVLFLCCCCGGGSGCGKKISLSINPCYLLIAFGFLFCCGGISFGERC